MEESVEAYLDSSSSLLRKHRSLYATYPFVLLAESLSFSRDFRRVFGILNDAPRAAGDLSEELAATPLRVSTKRLDGHLRLDKGARLREFWGRTPG